MSEHETTVGVYLKTARRQRGMSLAEIASETRVPEASLRMIEDDHLDKLPGEVFVRGFLRAYAKSVGAPEDEVLSRLERPSPSASSPFIPSAKLDLRRRRIATPALLLVLLLAAVLITLVLWRPISTPSFSAHAPPPPTGTAG